MPANTAVSYQYRDACNYKSRYRIVVAGTPKPGDFEAITDKLEMGDGFIPSQVGMMDLQEDLQQWDTDAFLDEDGHNPDDHPWHELNLPEDVELTDEEPTVGLTWSELVAAFEAVTWNELDPALPV